MRAQYTVDSATRTLPYVKSVVGEVRELYDEIQELSRRHNTVPKRESELRADLRGAIREKAGRLHECQEELWKIGVELKAYDQGLVDFPAVLGGRPIHLCWEWGEDGVGFWHETNSGYFGRQRIPEGCPSWPAGATVAPAAPE